MATEVKGRVNGQCVAAADLRTARFKFVKITAARAVNLATVAGEAVLGVLQNTPNTGAEAEVMIGGQTKVIASAAIAAGAKITTTAAGLAVTAGAGNIPRGIALEAAAAANDVISIELFENLGQL